MKNKRTILTVGIILVLACTGWSQQYDSPDDFETREVVVNGTRGIMITNYKGTKREVRIPPRINNLPVLIIGGDADEFREKVQANDGNFPENWAFSNKQLASITIPNSVTTIGTAAFTGNQLVSVTIPNSVMTIGSMAFYENQLTSVTIPNSVTTIGDLAFSTNQFTSVTIPNSVTTIGAYAFSRNRLTSVTIPNSVTTIREAAFLNNQLASVTILSGSNTMLGDGVFFNNPVTSITCLLDGPSFSYILRRINNSLESLGIIIDKDNVTGSKLRSFSIEGLEDCYVANGRKAGTYTFNGRTELWSKTR